MLHVRFQHGADEREGENKVHLINVEGEKRVEHTSKMLD
jgi:hypothetical protein